MSVRNYNGRTALHQASYNGHAEALHELLKRDGVNVPLGADSSPRLRQIRIAR